MVKKDEGATSQTSIKKTVGKVMRTFTTVMPSDT
jgi:hypothetical protein